MNHQVSLAWTAGAGDVSFNVYRGTKSGGPYTKIASAIASPAYQDQTVNPGSFFYVVTGLDANGLESGPSNEVTTTIAGPAAPSGLAITSSN